jgi:predicted acetyltransferase
MSSHGLRFRSAARLTPPGVSVHGSFVEALREYRLEGRYLDLDPAGLEDPSEFAAYVEVVRSWSIPGATLPSGWVPCTELWHLEGDQFIGRVSIRHRLTVPLRRVGGHIGYDVRPTARGQGHATEMLRQALPIANRLGIDPALLTCDRDNVASRRIMERHGGVLEGETPEKLRYWVPTRS